ERVTPENGLRRQFLGVGAVAQLALVVDAPTVRRPTGRDGTGVEVSAVQRLDGQPPDRGHGCKRKVSRRIAELADVVAAPAICLPCCRETAGMEETVGDFPEAESTIHGRGAGTGGRGGVAESAVELGRTATSSARAR